MNNILNVARYMPKGISAFAAVLLAVIIPLQVFGANEVTLESQLSVANTSRGETTYQKEATSASFDETVTFQVYFHNMEAPDSDLVAKDVNLAIDFPTTAGAVQTVTSTIGGSNTNTVVDTASVNINRADASLEFIPGSVQLKHNVGTRSNINYETIKLGDDFVTNPDGAIIKSEQLPCYEYEATVTFQARIVVEQVQIDKTVRVKGTDAFVTSANANPGDTLQYRLEVKNAGNSVLNNVIVRDNLPPRLSYVAGSTKLKSALFPNGTNVSSDNIVNGGINIQTMSPGGNAFILFEVTVPEVNGLECGTTQFRNVGVVHPEGMNQVFNTADIYVEGEVCEEPQPQTLVCNALTANPTTLRIGEKISFNTDSTVTNGATVSGYSYNFGDGSTQTTGATADHTYTAAGDFTASVRVSGVVDGQNVKVTSDNCKVDIEVEESETPIYKCVGVEANQLVEGLKARVKAIVFADNGATVNNVRFDYGDNSDPFVTNNLVDGDNGTQSVTTDYAYEKAGAYDIVVTVSFDVDGEQVDVICRTSIDIEDEPEVCKYNSELAADSSDCKEDEKTPNVPAVLPNTGPGSVLLSIFGASAIATMLRSWLASRRSLATSMLS